MLILRSWINLVERIRARTQSLEERKRKSKKKTWKPSKPNLNKRPKNKQSLKLQPKRKDNDKK
jgi:hypothetical protein